MTKSVIEDLVRVKPKKPNQSVHLTLPVPPSVNSIHANTRTGGKRLTPLAKNYTRIARAVARQVVSDSKWSKTSKSEWVYCDLVFYFPDRKIRDAHNCLKILMDVLEGIVYENDYSVMPRIQGVKYDKNNPRVEVRFRLQTDEEHERSLAEHV